MKILAIESSCDETAAAIVENGRTILSSVIASQFQEHQDYGGVVPEIASRTHIRAIVPVVEQALEKASLTFSDLDCLAVTKGPGLIGSLLVGVSFAKALSYSKSLPLVGVNHIDGHLASALMQPEKLLFPAIGLVASGGHTNLYLVHDPLNYTLIGQTQDDAAGEAFDKVAKILGLGFPGGPALEKKALGGNTSYIHFPRSKVPKYNFSFSGIKTSVAYWVRDHPNESQSKPSDISASFQEAMKDMLCNKTFKAAKEHSAKSVFISGGVSRNSFLRQAFEKMSDENGLTFFVPDFELCTDNAVMIAAAAYPLAQKKSFEDLNLTPKSVLHTQKER